MSGSSATGSSFAGDIQLWGGLRSLALCSLALLVAGSGCGLRLRVQLRALLHGADGSTLLLLAEKLNAHSFPVMSVDFSPDGTRIVSGAHRSIKLWGAWRSLVYVDLCAPDGRGGGVERLRRGCLFGRSPQMRRR